MQLTQKEMQFIRQVDGARFAVESPAAIDLSVAALFSPVFQSRALQVGDEVIVSCLSTPVVVETLIRHGLTPVFVDICFPTYQILPDEVEEAIDPDKCAAIFLPHIWGNPFDLFALRDLADEYGLWLLSEGFLGAESGGKSIGSIEDVSVFIQHHALTCSSQLVYEQIKSMHLYQYWDRFSGTFSEHPLSIDVTKLELLDEYFEGHSRFEVPGSLTSSVPAWIRYPITLKKSCGFRRDEYLKVLQPEWYELPQSVWRQYRNPKRQEQKMYGVDAVMDNTVLVNPVFAYDVITATKQFKVQHDK